MVDSIHTLYDCIHPHSFLSPKTLTWKGTSLRLCWSLRWKLQRVKRCSVDALWTQLKRIKVNCELWLYSKWTLSIANYIVYVSVSESSTGPDQNMNINVYHIIMLFLNLYYFSFLPIFLQFKALIYCSQAFLCAGDCLYYLIWTSTVRTICTSKNQNVAICLERLLHTYKYIICNDLRVIE